jgi:hypothetical protein
MMTLVGRIERMDRADRTKNDYKSLIRKLFRWLGREDVDVAHKDKRIRLWCEDATNLMEANGHS